MVLSFVGIIASLAFLVIFAYRGHSVVVVAPCAALIAVALAGEPIMGMYTQVFMPAMGGFVTKYFPLFMFGAIFGYLMNSTGLARDLARGITALLGPRRALLSTVIATALLTYGGVSAWVIAFTVVPIAVALFKEAQIPHRLMPAAIALGTITFALAALPGSPQIHNAIPTSYFGTNVYAAPVFGVTSAAIMLVAGIGWLEFRAKRLYANGEGYEPLDAQGNVIATPAGIGGADDDSGEDGENASFQRSNAQNRKGRTGSVVKDGMLGLLPILFVVAVNFTLVYFVAPRWNADYLASEKFGETTLDTVIGLWSPTIALASAVGVIVAMNPRRAKRSLEEFSEGAKNAILPCLTTASEVGYGAVIAALTVFTVIKENMLGISDNALVVSTVSTAVISGITGSSAGGLSIAMETLGEQLAQLATQQGISVELMHRVTAMASVSFDSLPHNGAVLTMLMVCGMTHKLAYKDVAVVTIVIPLATLAIMLGVNAIIPGLV